MDLAEFLLARIAEDEANIEGDWADGFGLHIISVAMHDRMVAECEAKYRIREAYEGTTAPALKEVLGYAARAVASVYADHPDYRQEWRP